MKVLHIPDGEISPRCYDQSGRLPPVQTDFS